MWHSLEKKEVLEKLKTNEEGLSEKEASVRLKQYGKNELKQTNKINPFFIFLEQFKALFIIILFGAAIFSFFIKHYIDFAAIIMIILINASVGFFQQYKAEKIIIEMKNILVPKVKVMRDGKISEVSSVEIVPGDLIQISEGDRITADCRLIHSNELQTNEAVLTGESFPCDKSSEKIATNTPLAERHDMIYAGTTIVRGNAQAIVVATGMNTEFGKIAEIVQEIKQEKTPFEKKLNGFSKVIAIIVVILTTLTVIIGVAYGQELYNMILAGISLAISVIPEGLPAVITITLAFAIKRMQKQKALIRKISAAETLGRTTVICTDKTGTLTEEKISVSDIYCNHERFNINEGSFYLKNKKISPIKERDLAMILKAGILCNNARLEINGKKIEIFGDPTEKALVLSAYQAGFIKKYELEKEIRIKEYAFSSDRKIMSIVRKNKQGFTSYVKGAPDILLKKCSKELINGNTINLTERRRKEILEELKDMDSRALRVLAFAFKGVPERFNQKLAENNLIFLGLQGMLDAPRKEVKKAIMDCKTAGIKIKMITGDSMITAKAIAEMIGLGVDAIDEDGLRKLTEKEFSECVKQKTIFARITPEFKLKIIKTLKEQKEIVAVTGDGVNDILALKEAHIGIAMGIRGTDVTRDVSDIILLDDNFGTIVNAVKEGRKVYDNLKKSIKFQLSANVDELFVFVFAIMMSMPLPFLPLAILWINLVTDSLPSLALSVEKEEEDLMERKPINQKESLLKDTYKFIILAGFFAFLITIMLFSLYYEKDLVKARTMALTASVFSELFIAIACRSNRKNIWKLGMFSNKPLLIAISIAASLQIIAIYTPLSNILGIKAISLLELALTIGLSSLGFVLFEIIKFFKIKI